MEAVVSDLQAHPFICYSMTRDSLTFVEDQGMGLSLLPSAQQMPCACPWFNPGLLPWLLVPPTAIIHTQTLSQPTMQKLSTLKYFPFLAYAAMNVIRTRWCRQSLHLLYLYHIPKLALSAPAT